jgi:cytochrome P450
VRRLPDGPRAVTFLRNEFQFWRNALEFLPRLHRAHGDLVRLRLLGRMVVAVFAPDHVHQVTKAPEEEFTVSTVSGRRLTHDVQGRGPLNSEGADHIRYREICRQSLAGEAMNAYSSITRELTDRMLDSWRVGDELDLLPTISGLTRHIFKYFMFGTDVVVHESPMNDAVEEYMYTLGNMRRFVAASLIPRDIPGVSNGGRLRRRMALMDARVAEIERGLISTVHHSLAAAMLDTLAGRGEERESSLVRELIMQLYFAGTSTVSATTTWTLLTLALHPHEHSLVLDELRRRLGGDMPTMRNVLSLPVLDAAVHETLRLYPTGVYEFKQTTAPAILDGHELDTGFPILLSPWVTQRRPTVFDEPLCFRPERFANGPPYVKGAFHPWGVGYQSCVGRIVARVAMHTIIAGILQRYRLDLLPGQRIDPYSPPYSGRLLPSPRVRVRVAKQDGDVERCTGPITGAVVGSATAGAR